MKRLVVCAAFALSGCASSIPAVTTLAQLPSAPCAKAVDVTWYGPSLDDDRQLLSHGCESVSAPIVVARRRDLSRLPASPHVIHVVSWNMHEGRGDLDRLIATLPSPFVLLIQEAVPAITDLARAHDLYAAYVPSMPNGRGRPARYADRGNAIVSSLPLDHPAAIELPWVYQRRVAVMATVGDTRVVCVHLDNRPGRKRQAEALAAFLRTVRAPRVIVGGDLNTWFGAGEETVSALDAVVPRVRACGDAPTFRFGRRLDYIFTSIPAAAKCEVMTDTFGSDHHPVALALF
ncbi:MAG TPA: endonuclease/exonuclease/phosphatase family protein [Vicinamibacterales bacterium]|nr:endonuclease/exonuclease/phosphatase family protein [Vicinamibacterales bacterium]